MRQKKIQAWVKDSIDTLIDGAMISHEAGKFLRESLIPEKPNKYSYYASPVVNAAEYEFSTDNVENFLVELAHFKYAIVKKMFATLGGIPMYITEITSGLDIISFDLIADLEKQDKDYGILKDWDVNTYGSVELNKFGQFTYNDILGSGKEEKEKAEIISFSVLKQRKQDRSK